MHKGPALRLLRTGVTVLALLLLVSACGSSGATETSRGAIASDTSTTAGESPRTTSAGGVGTDDVSNIVGSAQNACYDNTAEMPCPTEGEAFYGQDAQSPESAPSYTDNGDGTVTDDITGLMWQQEPVQNVTYDEAVAGAGSLDLAGYDDWRLPTIKELYSLIVFSGNDPSGCDAPGADCGTAVPFIDTGYFGFEYGDASAGERMIDAQFASSNVYVGSTRETMALGVNFADGRIKGYGLTLRGRDKTFDVLYVRGNTGYGVNDLADNGDGTISDRATGLTWTQADNGEGVLWEDALDYCATLDTNGIGDWRLPTVKELQGIVDYARSPVSTESAAIDPLFDVSVITDEAGDSNYPNYWSSTTHASLSGGQSAAYVAFGEAQGWMQFGGEYTLVDIHGAGAQRSDPKTGDPAEFEYGRGPQGDVIRIFNYATCVAGA